MHIGMNDGPSIGLLKGFEETNRRYNRHHRIEELEMRSSIEKCRTDEEIAQDRADWLIDAIATATQDRRFLRGEEECDNDLCEVIKLNAIKAIRTALNHKDHIQWV